MGTRRLLHFPFQSDCQTQFLDYPASSDCMGDSEGSVLSVYEVTIKPLEHAASHAWELEGVITKSKQDTLSTL